MIRISALLTAAALLQGCVFVDWLGGNFHDDMDPRRPLSPEAQALVDRAYEGFSPGQLHDFHTHVVGYGTRECGAFVNPHMRSWVHPLKRIEALVYLSASGVEDEDDADAEYVERLTDLANALPIPGKFHILAFDWYYDDKHRPVPEKSTFYMSNECVERLWKSDEALFVPVMSVNPYRPGATRELEHWAGKGVRYIKWLPNAQGIDAGDPALDDYYRTMIRNDMILLTHVGEEKAVEAEEDQALGNPRCFLRPLDMGLKIIMAHSASLGTNKPLGYTPGGDKDATEAVSNFDLFVDLMRNEKYVGRLFGEISAMTQANRLTEGEPEDAPLVRLLAEPDLRAMLETRFVNGSDYPLPGINVVIRTRTLVEMGLITGTQRDALNEIYRRNPLEFDYVLKRTLAWKPAPDSGEAFSLPRALFRVPPGLEAAYPEALKRSLDDPAVRRGTALSAADRTGKTGQGDRGRISVEPLSPTCP